MQIEIVNPAQHAMLTKLLTMPTLQVLDNGGHVKIRRKLLGRLGTVEAEIVLCHLPHNHMTPWVTWQRNVDQFEGCYWGHYFDSPVDAFNDYNDRGF